MQVSVESTGTLERTMRVEIPEQRIAQEVENRLLELLRTSRLQGFRPGKAPMKVIQQRFGQRVRQEVIGEVVQTSFFEAVSRENLRPAGHPHIDLPQVQTGSGVSYTARFEILPDFELVAAEQLKVEKPSCSITEADIDRMIETLRTQRRKLAPVERAARSQDIIDFDFSGSKGGEPFEGGTGKDIKAELGAGRLIAGLEDALIGKSAGDEFQFDFRFPDDHADEQLRGKDVRYAIKVNKVHEAVLPEVNEEFFQAFGVKEGGMTQFRKELREHMEREASSVIRTRLRDAVMDALYGAHTLTLPRSMVERERHRLRHQFSANLKAAGVEVGEHDARLNDPALFDEQARKRVALQLIVGELVRKQELKADPRKVRGVIEKNAQSYEDPSAIVGWYYAEPERLAEVEAVVLEDEVIDWVTARAELSEAGVSFDELVNKRQTAKV